MTSPHDSGAPPAISGFLGEWQAARAVAGPVSGQLPDFPWDHLVGSGDRARAHPDGIVDLSVGTPVDPTPEIIQEALRSAVNSPGYPGTAGRVDTRQSCVDWLARRFGVTGLHLNAVLPVIGSKELIASLPSHLGLGPGDLVVYPALAYPTYEVGAKLAGARSMATDALTAVGPERVALVWINSPSNPTGKVLPVDHLRKVVAWCRERGALLVSDECYLEFGWDSGSGSGSNSGSDSGSDSGPISVLHPDVCAGDHTGIVAIHSLSKRSNVAGYRCAFAAGDPGVIAELLAVRKNLGLQMPGPQQAAMRVALDDDQHVAEQHARYAARRGALKPAFEAAGFRIDHSEASLYLWATRGEGCWDTVSWLADRGILVAPGEFYGAAGAEHVRISLTATDERVAAGVRRLG